MLTMVRKRGKVDVLKALNTLSIKCDRYIGYACFT